VAVFLNGNVSFEPLPYFGDIQRLAFISFQLWTFAFCCIKISTLSTLLRFKEKLWWRVLIIGLIITQIGFTLADSIFQLANYSILSSEDCALNPDAPCIRIYAVLLYIEASFQITTNIVVSLLPAVFLAQLRRPVWEKILIGLMMSMCLVASAFSIRKTILNNSFADPNQNVADVTVAWFNYNSAELFIEIAAACIYGLKPSFFHMLQTIGFTVTNATFQIYETADELPDFHTFDKISKKRRKSMPLCRL
jgi:hypothetical protein